MERVLVTGKGGMLAWDLIRALESRKIPFIALDRVQLDITDAFQISTVLDREKPTSVWNAAAYTDVDGAEKERISAERINSGGPRAIAEACSRRNIGVIHFGSDQVFDGTGNCARTEEDKPNPVNFYGATKLGGELAVLENSRNLVLRVQWLYGERKDRFTPLKSKDRFTPFSDQIGCPTWTRFLAETTVELWERRAQGLYHFAHDDWASWAEVYSFACQELGYRTELHPMLTEQARLAARRPKFSVLSNRKLRETLGRSSLGSWKAQLRSFLSIVK